MLLLLSILGYSSKNQQAQKAEGITMQPLTKGWHHTCICGRCLLLLLLAQPFYVLDRSRRTLVIEHIDAS